VVDPVGHSRRPSIVDVAAAAGVSKSTVSRAMLDQSGISAATRERIAEAARELGYVKDTRAQALKTTSTQTVALLVRSARLSFYGELMALLQQEIEANGMRFAVTTQSAAQSAENALDQVMGLRPNALIVASGRVPDVEIERHARTIPVVLVGPQNAPHSVGTVSDDSTGAEILASLVVVQGHREVAVLAHSTARSSTIARRSERMIQALTQQGATVRVVRLSDDDTPLDGDLAEAVRHVTAIMCPSDPTMVATWERLREWQIDVPGDISLTGYDGVGQLASPVLGLTTWRQPLERLARAASAQVIGRLYTAHAPARHESFTGRLIRGRTLTGAPAAALDS